jgi:hypothetical protein
MGALADFAGGIECCCDVLELDFTLPELRVILIVKPGSASRFLDSN